MITSDYCPMDCRLFIQEPAVVHDFNRTTGELSLYTNDSTYQGLEIEYAIRCEAVFSKSGVQTSGWVSVSGGAARSSTNTAVRYGDDSIFVLNHQRSGSCSDDSFSASDYDELLPKNKLQDLEFHLYGSISHGSNSCEELECAGTKIWNWFDCECQCPDVHICENTPATPDFNEETCTCECSRDPDCCPAGYEFSRETCGCVCAKTQADCNTPALP